MNIDEFAKKAIPAQLKSFRDVERRLKIELRDVRAKIKRIERGETRKTKSATSKGIPTPLANYKQDRDECDKLMARIVKVEQVKCEECGNPDRYALQWAHGFSRSYRTTRWERRNGFCLCVGCHKKFTHNAVAWEAWMRRKLGDQEYDLLRQRTQMLTRFNPMILVGLRAAAEKLGVLTDEGWKNWQEGLTTRAAL